MNIRTALLSISAAVLLLSGCGQSAFEADGPLVTEERPIGGVDAIDLSAPVDARIIVDPSRSPSLSLTAPQDAMPYLLTADKGGALSIRVKDEATLHSRKPVTAVIIVPSLKALHITGAGNVEVDGNVSGRKLDVSSTGAGNVVLKNAVVDLLALSITGAGDISVRDGKAQTAELEISGAGNIDALGCATENTSVGITGAGDARVRVARRLKVDISGAGKVRYAGSPPVIEKSITGAGSLEPVN